MDRAASPKLPPSPKGFGGQDGATSLAMTALPMAEKRPLTAVANDSGVITRIHSDAWSAREESLNAPTLTDKESL
ncbi:MULTISPECIES: hypothetical protein [unclassified Bradyrhizobium]|uniref:hypothetical protein n=1 Tax=unclassified Bradyrhizobium TaxID=2631580 RepID=UPI0030D5F041